MSDLIQFLLESNEAGFVTGDEKKWTKEKDSSTTIVFEKDNWKSHDNFFGGEPYGGRIIVSKDEKSIWMMVYYGWVEESVNPDEIYDILRGALKLMPPEAPFRGPKKFSQGKYFYQNHWEGDVEKYHGEEEILLDGKQVYKAFYMGGLVDQRRGV